MDTFPDFPRILDDWGLTQSEMARRLGVTQSLVSFWVRAERRPSAKMAMHIEKTLNIPRGLLRSDYWPCPPQYQRYLLPAAPKAAA